MFWQQKQTFNNHTKEKKILVVLGCRSLCKAAQVNNAVFSIQYVEKRTKDNSGEKPEVLGSLAALEFGKQSRNSTGLKKPSLWCDITPVFLAVHLYCPRKAVARSASDPSASPAILDCVASTGRLLSSYLTYFVPCCSTSPAPEGAAEPLTAEENSENQPLDGGYYKEVANVHQTPQQGHDGAQQSLHLVVCVAPAAVGSECC